MGSACHSKGSAEVVEIIKNFLNKYDIEHKIKFSGVLCLGKCKEGINILWQGKRFSHINKDNISQFLVREIMPILEDKNG